MSQHSRSRPFSLTSADLAKVREAFAAAGFDEARVAEACGAKTIAGLRDVPAELAWRRTSAETPLNTLIRLFVIGLGASPEAAKKALAPAPIERLVGGGLLRSKGGALRANLKMVPIDGLLVAFDRSWEGEKLEAPDHVMGPSESARRLAGVTLRGEVKDALDLGAGCGYLALLAARHAGKVVASDVNPRAAAFAELNAALNGIESMEALTGDLFAPVADRAFDLVFSNPPFMISPEDRLTYLSGGMKADAFCQRVATEVPRYLREGGYCQMLCSWVELEGGDWQERLRGWFEGSGCDVWVLRSSTTDAVSYAVGWVNTGHHEPAGEGSDRLNAWLEYYRQEKIQAIGAGVVTMRKRGGGDNWFRSFDGPERLAGPCGPHVLQRMQALDFLARRAADDEALMRSVLAVSPHARLTQECAPTAEGWAQAAAHVRIVEGFAYLEEVDTYVGELLVACDGKRTLRAAIDRTAKALGWGPEDVPEETAAIVRQLVDEGFLIPADAKAG
jgi:methylase of polypeptide subunit release factors